MPKKKTNTIKVKGWGVLTRWVERSGDLKWLDDVQTYGKHGNHSSSRGAKDKCKELIADSVHKKEYLEVVPVEITYKLR